MKNEGIKSVDIKIEAEGYGIVNWNGTASLYLGDNSNTIVSNHLLPKLRGIDLYRTYNFKQIDDTAKLYISQNCIRQAIFKDYSYGLKTVTLNNVSDVLCSILGLVRGYVIAENSTSLKRKSSLYITDFLSDDDTKLNFEQFTQAGARDKTSIFSKHTTGNVKYSAYASINIEELQFLPLEDSLGRSCFREAVSEVEGIELAKKITESLKNLDFSGKLNPQAIFNNNYVRVNSICEKGEAGILLNDDAIDLLVKEVIELVKNLNITRTSGYVAVTNIVVDYNSGRALRLKNDIDVIEKSKIEKYRLYYKSDDLDSKDFSLKMEQLKGSKKNDKEDKSNNKKTKATNK